MRRELETIVAALEAAPADETLALATLVRLQGSGYRRPGARMLVRGRGELAGFLSGGCLEEDVRERAASVLDGGPATVVRYDTRGEADRLWGLASGCNGIVDILLAPVPGSDDPAHPARLLDRVRARETGVLATVIDVDPPSAAATPSDGAPDVAAVGDTAFFGDDDPGEPTPPPAKTVFRAFASCAREASAAARSTCREHSIDGVRTTVFLEHVGLVPRVVLAGAGPDATALAWLAHAAGWSVVVADPSAGRARPDRFPDADAVVATDDPREFLRTYAPDGATAIVVMAHHFDRDAAFLRAALASPAPYVGALGPRARTAEILATLEADGVAIDEPARARLFGPVGLDIGATTPEEIAVSIVSEIRAVLSGRAGGPLRDRRGPIHEDPA